ncbi:MAG: pyridoxamine 5'-phosphate oxidase family protein [Euryarchaeota archaeon]|nr:pyridoxamine 5'-phosphate oxidase family protein [Euryarchaeota archaeon]
MELGPEPRDPREVIRQAIEKILREHRFAVLATHGEGDPWCSTVFYAPAPGHHLYFGLGGKSRTLRHIRGNPRVGFAVGIERETRFLQGNGEALLLDDPGEARAAREAVAAKVPIARPFIEAKDARMVRLRVERYYVTDFRKLWMDPRTFDPPP